MSDIWSLGGEWEFSAEELLKRKNVMDFNEEGTFIADSVKKEKNVHAFWVYGTWICGESEEEAILEVVLDVQEIPQVLDYPVPCLEREKLHRDPQEMTAGEILSLPWSEYTICPMEWLEGGEEDE